MEGNLAALQLEKKKKIKKGERASLSYAAAVAAEKKGISKNFESNF